MIKMLTACTSEIDEVEVAVEQVLSQLNLEHELLDNSVGILSCYSEFVETGVVRELCARLPFDVIGETTLGSAVPGFCGLEQLSISVLTSDELSFSTALSEPIEADSLASAIDDTCKSARGKLSGDPSLVISFTPLVANIGGETMLERIDDSCGGVPVYGGISCDHTMAYEDSWTIWNGRAERSSMAVLMILGDIKPRFYIVSISESKLKKQEATITDSEGCMVKAVNDMPFVDFLSDAGLTMDGGMEATAAVPFLIGYCDGTQPLARSLYSITPEGYGLFGCLMPSHAPLWMGTIDYIDIMETTSALMQKTMESENISCVLMFPCLSRSLLIEPNADHEMRKVMEIIGGRAPYHLAYVGGEMCPVYDEGGVARNRFHNFTYTVCVF